MPDDAVPGRSFRTHVAAPPRFAGRGAATCLAAVVLAAPTARAQSEPVVTTHLKALVAAGQRPREEARTR
jgi:hypothetical protein